MLGAKQIEQNWDTLIKLIEDNFVDERKKNLLVMYKHFESRLMFTPASSKEHFHNAFPGGYVEHVLNITNAVKKVYKLWDELGANINFTTEELIFATIHHDLGKIGSVDLDYYIPNQSDWHRKNQGKIYTPNPQLQYMNVADRSMWLLQHFNIKITENELLGIKLADGMYDEANKSYYMSFSPDFELKTNLPYIIHQADMIASKIERDKWKYKLDTPTTSTITKKIQKPKITNNPEKLTEIKDAFDELFA
jgi:hypothetical protein